MSDSPGSMYSSEFAAPARTARTASIPGVADLVRAIPEFRAGKWRLGGYRVTEIRRQRRKRIVFGVMSYREGKRVAARRVVTKVYGSDRGARSLAALRQLWSAGFHAPSVARVPQPFGYERRAGALYQGHATGVQWADLLSGEAVSLKRASRRAARWLARLRATPIDAPCEPPSFAARQLRAACLELCVGFPDHRARIAPLGRAIARDLIRGGNDLGSSHGDYHPKNVFLASRFVTVIDFDTFALREPAHDVGYAVAQLLIMSFFRTGSFGAGAQAAGAFLSTASLLDVAEWKRVRAHVARSFVQSLRYELCTLHNGRTTLLRRWPDAAERALASESAAAFLHGLA